MATAATAAGPRVHRGPGTGGPSSIPKRPGTPEDVDKLQHLLQVIVRMFYDDAAVMILDQVMRFRVIPVDLLASRLGVTPKDLKVVAKKLLDDQLIVEDGRSELPAGATHPGIVLENGMVPARMRPQRRYYYLYDPLHTFRAIQWRITEMFRSIQAATASVDALTTRGYICPKCGAKFTSFDAARLFDPNTNDFRCETPGCFTELRADEDRASTERKDDRMKRFNEQFEYLLSHMRQFEDIDLPSIDLETWLSDNGNAEWRAYDLNDKEVQALRRGEGVAVATSTTQAPTAAIERDEDGIAIASGTNNSIGTGLQVDVSAVLDPEAAAARAKQEAELKAQTAESNALPAWHLTSTVSGEKTTLGLQEDKRQAGLSFTPLGPGASETSGTAGTASGAAEKGKDAYDDYASLLDQERDDEDDFEEVEDTSVPATVPSVGTKRPLEEVNTRAALEGAKRARIDTPAASSAAPTSSAPRDEDDEEEFEEV